MPDDFMSHLLAEIHSDVPHDVPLVDVPSFLDSLTDGRPVIVYGDVPHDRLLWHPQGDNIFGFGGDCGLVSAQGILQEFGRPVTESDVVRHAIVAGECEINLTDLEKSGGSTWRDQAKLLTEMGVPAHPDSDHSLESLAEKVESGHGTIIEVNAGILWDKPEHIETGGINHAVDVIGVARDVNSGEVVGFYINDSGPRLPDNAGRFISAELMEKAYIEAGGVCVVTDNPRPNIQPVSDAIS